MTGPLWKAGKRRSAGIRRSSFSHAYYKGLVIPNPVKRDEGSLLKLSGRLAIVHPLSSGMRDLFLNSPADCLWFPLCVSFVLSVPVPTSILENKINREHKEEETYQMVDLQRFVVENEDSEKRKDYKCDGFLDHLELPEVERASIALVTDTVCRDLENILEQGYAPAEKDNCREAPPAYPPRVLKLQMSIPCKGHECIRYEQKSDCI